MDIKMEIGVLLNLVKIPPEDTEKINEYLEYNEWGIAFEHFCATLFDEKIRITGIAFAQIRRIGEHMELEEQTWESLKSLVCN
ncbi:MafI family immunity protein [Paenibacillus sp. 481]|uniref:MafI family immunity protein n=1 Tax=Paenibacillus sp. 481 TaxID=2835869 RepID=UPI001E563BFC|nr:MafI family immunity protein [Paenibacillus sp. 481]UHA74525.1 MafI family immunity protein [Paenibacillus sp. 481]